MSSIKKVLSVAAWGMVCATMGAGCYGDGVAHVTGSVRDRSGAPIAGATVVLAVEPGQPAIPVTTDQAGEFSAMDTCSPAVSQRGFTLRVEKPGFQPVERQVSNDSFNLLITLSPAETTGGEPSRETTGPR